MYRLLIVEDEEEIREGIRSFLEEEMDCFEIKTARNGEKALDILLEERVDAMILDIRMPVMDGVTLLSELEKREIRVATVILSGHDEFEYAKTALEYGAFQYILKPVTPDEVMKVAMELKAFLDKNARRTEELEMLKEQVRQNMSLLRERFIGDIIAGRMNEEAFRAKAAYYDVNAGYDRFQVAVVDVPSSMQLEDAEGRELLKQLIENILTGFTWSEHLFDIFHVTSDEIALLFHLEEGVEEPGGIVNGLAAVKRELEKVAGCDITIGIGSVYQGVAGIRKSYFEAANSLKHKIIMGSGSILCYWDIRAGDGMPGIEFDLEEFKLNLRLDLEEEVKASLDRAFDELMSRSRKVRLENVYSFTSLVIAAVASVISESGKSVRDVFPDCLNPFVEVYRCSTVEDMKNWIFQLVDGCMRFIRELRAGKSRTVVEMAVRIVDEHFTDDVTTKYLAERLFLNQDYLGRIFKSNTGMTVNDYLNKIRVGKARELLKGTNLMIYEVAQMVGFNDQHYFSTVFRKITGVTPSQYKEV